jgi:hypothetical protein
MGELVERVMLEVLVDLEAEKMVSVVRVEQAVLLDQCMLAAQSDTAHSSQFLLIQSRQATM